MFIKWMNTSILMVWELRVTKTEEIVCIAIDADFLV